MPDILRILFLSGKRTAEPLRTILDACTHTETVYSLIGLLASLQRNRYDVLLCAWNTHEGTWRDAHQRLTESGAEVPLIVISDSGTEAEWVEVLQAGAFDLLTAPYTRTDVLSILEHAASSSRVKRQSAGEALLGGPPHLCQAESAAKPLLK